VEVPEEWFDVLELRADDDDDYCKGKGKRGFV